MTKHLFLLVLIAIFAQCAIVSANMSIQRTSMIIPDNHKLVFGDESDLDGGIKLFSVPTVTSSAPVPVRYPQEKVTYD